MSRAAFFDALTSDVALNGLDVNEDTVFQNWTLEERPTSATPFVILQWGGNDRIMWQSHRPAEQLTMWVHIPYEKSNDFTDINKIIDAVDDAVIEMRDLPGIDDYTLSFVEIGSRSGDLKDEGFNTIAKNATYEVHSRRSV